VPLAGPNGRLHRPLILAQGHSPPAPPLHGTDVGENNPTLIALRLRRAVTAPFAAPLALPPARASSKENAVDKAYLEDLAPGQVFTSEARAVVDAGSIKTFAGEFD
jgi:hypothetical protein